MMEKSGCSIVKAEPQQQVSSTITADLNSEALHCPKCLHPLAPPVFQCAAGHVVCSSCHGDLPDKAKCASCFVKPAGGYTRFFVPTRYTRCLAMERVLGSLRVACRNARNASGSACTAVAMPYHEKAEHERTCVGVRVSSVVAMGPCGGIGGAPWEMDLHGVGRVLKLVVRHGSAIDAMSVCYERDGREEQSTRWGGPGGRRSEICLQPDEYLAGVKGHVGHYDNCLVVRSLTFVTNARRSFGPYGKEERVPFALPAAVAGGRIIGFFGSSGLYLDAIGTYVQMD